MSKTGFIYKLAHNDPEIKEIYIGSTDNLRLRKSSHKHCCNTETNKSYNFRVYQFIRSNGGFSNFNIFQIEEIKYNTKYELHARERYHIELLNPSLNKATPNRTHQEWEEKNKEGIEKAGSENDKLLEDFRNIPEGYSKPEFVKLSARLIRRG